MGRLPTGYVYWPLVKKPRIVVIAPLYNEKGKIGNAIRRIPRAEVDEVIVVNDASTDGSREEAEAAGARIIDHPKTEGVGAAIRTGYQWGLKEGFDILVVIAGNDKDEPTEIPRLVKPIIDGQADYVQGSRYREGGRYGKLPKHRLILTRAYTWFVRLVTGCPITDATNGFRAVTREVLLDPRIKMDQEWLNRGELEYYIQLKVIKYKYRFAEVPCSKIYPDLSGYWNYTKIKPFTDWLRNLRPIMWMMLGVDK